MAAVLTKKQLKEYHEAFNVFDRDSDGELSGKEISTVMRSIGYNPSQIEIQNLMNKADLNQDGSVNFDEFCKLMVMQIADTETEEEIIDAFRAFDKEGNGKITVNELIHIMKNLGEPMAQEDIDDMISQSGADKDGNIDYQEFVHRIMNG